MFREVNFSIVMDVFCLFFSRTFASEFLTNHCFIFIMFWCNCVPAEIKRCFLNSCAGAKVKGLYVVLYCQYFLPSVIIWNISALCATRKMSWTCWWRLRKSPFFQVVDWDLACEPPVQFLTQYLRCCLKPRAVCWALWISIKCVCA